MFSASKLRWILEHTENGFGRAEQGDLCAGNIDAWVLWNLTGGAVHATDLTNASRTQLLNLRTLAWDEDALNLFGIPAAALPEIKSSSAFYGETAPLDDLPGGIPIAAMIGDSHAALYGQAGFKPGSIKATYGTGSSLMTPIEQPTLSEMVFRPPCLGARESDLALEGNIYATGAAVQWLGELLALADPGPGVEKLARTVADTGGVYFVPALVGLGAPHWKESARGLITGLTARRRGGTTGPRHVGGHRLPGTRRVRCDASRIRRAAPDAVGGWRCQSQRSFDAVSGRHHQLPGTPQHVYGNLAARCGLPGRSGHGAVGRRGGDRGLCRRATVSSRRCLPNNGRHCTRAGKRRSLVRHSRLVCDLS